MSPFVNPAYPASIDSNVTGLAFAEESSLKTLPGSPVWFGLEPNTYTDLGASYTSVAREVIIADRQQLKGSITDLDAKGGFNQDLTQRNLTRLLQGFFYADAKEKPDTQAFNSTALPVTSVVASTHKYNAASGLAVFLAGHLILAKNFGVSANNGLKTVSSSAAGYVVVSETIADEASPPASAQFQAVGFKAGADDLSITVSGAFVILGSTTLDFTTLGLNVGEWIWIGGDNSANRFVTNPAGYARIKSIAAHSLTFDLTSFTAVNETTTGKSVMIFFGKTINNATAYSGIKRRTYHVERQMGSDSDGVMAEYLLGALPNEFTLNLPQANKVTADLAFVAIDVQENDGATGVLSGTRVASPGEAAFNTSHDLWALRIAVVDGTLNPASLLTYATDAKITLNNNVTPNKALAVFGGFEASSGDFKVSGTLTAYFESVDQQNYIKNNSSVNLTAILAANNAGLIFDIPQITLGGGSKKVEKNKPVYADYTFDASKNANGFTYLVTSFEYLPAVAMPS